MGFLSKKKVVPVTVITGFLGSGKSTLLNHILTDTSHGQKFAVVENELGAVSIDDQIIKRHVDEEIIEVTNGCICCSIRGDLVRALSNLYKKVKLFDGIIIETTGLADPAPIIQTFFQNPEIQNKFVLDGVVTVVDAKHILERLAEVKSDGAVNEAIEQIAFADKIILNKTDLVPNDSKLEAIEEEIKSINATVQILRTKYSKIDDPKKELLSIGGFDLDRALEMDKDFLNVERRHHKDRAVNSICMEIKGEMQMNLIQEWIGDLVGGEDEPGSDVEDNAHEDEKHDHSHEEENNVLYRYKGILAIKGIEKKFLFQGVGMVFNGSFTDEVWGENETRMNQFVFIGKNLDSQFLNDGFKACLAKDLRFPIGTYVEALYANDLWKEGTIIAHWDDGNPYRIRLEDKRKTEIWAPVDREEVIRLSDSAC